MSKKIIRITTLLIMLAMITCVLGSNIGFAKEIKSSYTVTYKKNLTLGEVNLPNGWVFEDSQMALDIGTYKCNVWNLADNKSKTVTVNVVKIKKKIGSKSITVNKGTSLTDSMLPDIDNGKLSLNGKQYKITKNCKITCTFIPNDTVHYEKVSVTLNVKLKGDKAKKTAKPKVTEKPVPTTNPTKKPKTTKEPDEKPTTETVKPEPSATPVVEPTTEPTSEPTTKPTKKPTTEPSQVPVEKPSAEPTEAVVTEQPESNPTEIPESNTEVPQVPSVTEIPLPTDNPAANPNYVPEISGDVSGGALTVDDETEVQAETKNSAFDIKGIIALVVIVISIIVGVVLVIRKTKRNKYKDFF